MCTDDFDQVSSTDPVNPEDLSSCSWDDYPRVGFPVSNASRRKSVNHPKPTRSAAKAVTHREISGYPQKPNYPVPMHSNRPSVQRTIRIVPVVSVGTPLDITPTLIALEDQAEYGTTSTRYTTMRILSARIWGAEVATFTGLTVTFRMPPGTTAATAGPVLEVLTDQPTPGAERCCVGYVYPYASRTLPFLVTSITPLFTVDNGAPAVQRTGDLIIDVTVLLD